MIWKCPACKWKIHYRDVLTKRDKILMNKHIKENHNTLRKNEMSIDIEALKEAVDELFGKDKEAVITKVRILEDKTIIFDLE
jgi:hypothetical protein